MITMAGKYSGYSPFAIAVLPQMAAGWGGHSESSRPHNRENRDERKFVRGEAEFTFFRARPRLCRLRERKALTFLPPTLWVKPKILAANKHD